MFFLADKSMVMRELKDSLLVVTEALVLGPLRWSMTLSPAGLGITTALPVAIQVRAAP